MIFLLSWVLKNKLIKADRVLKADRVQNPVSLSFYFNFSLNSLINLCSFG